MSVDHGKPVFVTGASGMLGVFIVRDLLAKGYRVRGSVRRLDAVDKVAPLRALPGAERLELVEADLSRPESFLPALKGCAALLHTATPIEIPLDGRVRFASEEEAMDRQVRPAVEGTEALLRHAAAGGVGRVVLTSSVAAMGYAREPPKILDEGCWSDEAFLRESLLTLPTAAYGLAKLLQERLAVRVCEELGLRLVCINPALIIGPLLTGHLNFSHALLVSLAEGAGSPFSPSRPGTVPDAIKGFCDVREAAQAHVLALKDGAEGRYLLQTHATHYADVVDVMRGHSATLRRHRRPPVDAPGGARRARAPRFSNARAKKLGVAEVGWRQSVIDSVHALEARMHIKEPEGCRLLPPLASAAAGVAAIAAAALLWQRVAAR